MGAEAILLADILGLRSILLLPGIQMRGFVLEKGALQADCG
jgi:hypothetical protein